MSITTFQTRMLVLGFRVVSIVDGKLVYISEAMLEEALSFVSGCSRCAWTPKLTLDYILDALTRNREPTVYVLPLIAKCTHCGHEIDRATFISVR